ERSFSLVILPSLMSVFMSPRVTFPVSFSPSCFSSMVIVTSPCWPICFQVHLPFASAAAHAATATPTAKVSAAVHRLRLRNIRKLLPLRKQGYLARLAVHSTDRSWPWRVVIILPLIVSPSSLPLYIVFISLPFWP